MSDAFEFFEKVISWLVIGIVFFKKRHFLADCVATNTKQIKIKTRSAQFVNTENKISPK